MRIAVITEGSTKHRNADILRALSHFPEHEVFNLGMQNREGEPELSYLETGTMSALLLNLKAVDMVIGGCGTGQGYMNAVLQFPGVACGLLLDPVDAWLFAQVNAGNCISLALNKGYGGVGADINLRYLLERLFQDPFGEGYPAHRKSIQQAARQKLAALSLTAHRSCVEILAGMDRQVLRQVLTFPGFREAVASAPEELDTAAGALKRTLLEALDKC